MKLTPKVYLHAFSLLAAALFTAPAHAANRAPRHPFPTVPRHGAPSRPVLEKRFVAWGEGDEFAEQYALEQASEWLESQVGWAPSAAYLRARGLVVPVDPTEEDKNRAKEIEQNWTKRENRPLKGPISVVAVELKVNAAQAAELQSLARQQRVVPRHLLLGRILAGAVALVLVCGGYLRLEEATRGYYTQLLRAAALLLLVGVGAGLWLMF